MQLRQDIQILRGLAVLSVVLFHLQVPALANGFLGVDVFFVISGFLMAQLYDKGTVLEFYARRIERLFPAYAVTILLALASGYFVLVPTDFNQLFDQAVAAQFFVSNVLYWNQNSYFDKSAFNPLLNLWSLAVEVQFYFAVPLLYPLIRRRTWIFTAIFCLSILSCLSVQLVSPKTAFFLAPFRVWQFLVGAGVAWYLLPPDQQPASLRSAFQVGAALALLLFPLVIELKPDAPRSLLVGHPALPPVIVTLLTGLVIRNGLPSAAIRSLSGRMLARLGDYSYPVYLVHFPILVLINYAPFGGTELALNGWQSRGNAMVLIVVLTVLLHRGFEVKRSGASKARYSAALFGAILVAAPLLDRLNLSKYNASESNIFAAWTDRDVYRCGKLFRILHPTDTACQLTASDGDRNILLVGDSHADAIKKVFSESARQLGFSTFFVVPNNPLLGSPVDAQKLITIASYFDIDVIYLHFSNIFDNVNARREISTLVERATSDGMGVVLIGPVVTYNKHVPMAMFADSAGRRDFVTSLAEHERKTQSYRAFIGTLKGSRVAVYDPAALLCPAKSECLFSTAESMPFYFDASHLTLTGASLLRPLFEESLRSLK